MTRAPGDLGEILSRDPKLRSLLESAGGGKAVERLERWAQEEQTRANDSRTTERLKAIEEAGADLLDAALCYALDTRDLDPKRPEHAAVIACSDAVTLGGVRRLRLRDEPRAAALRAAAKGGLLAPALDASRSADAPALRQRRPDAGLDAELASIWLRAFLRSDAPSIDEADICGLRAAFAAALALAQCRDLAPSLPIAEDLQRRLHLAELRQPLETLIGRNPRTGADRFAGRDQQRTQLRMFIDVLESQSGLESVSRGWQRGSRRVTDFVTGGQARGVTIVADGGLGKSALVAKFALDHFLQPFEPLPFVYLDFDSAALQPREPDQLFIEAARQIALEFPADAARLSLLRRELRRRIAARDRVITPKAERSDDAEVTEAAPLSEDPHGEFRGILRRAAGATSARVALVVLDTMETIQPDPAAIRGAREFLRLLCAEPFPELRVVAAGRAELRELDDFRGLDMISERRIALGPLSAPEAQTMVERLGADLMGADWLPGWSALVAGDAKDHETRREPLTLRVAVELVRASEPDKRPELVKEISALGADASKDFVARIYERRVVEHVRDEQVRKVAWPGLVARRITRDLLKKIVAPLCGLDEALSDWVFDRLASEVWIVERDGDALTHRADLRARTLPFMRRRDEPKFLSLVAALRDYYRLAGDVVETAYYRLLSGEHPRFLNDLTQEQLDRLARAERDFAAAWSPRDLEHAETCRAYMRSRSGPLMEADAYARLSPELAFAHLCRAGAGILGFDDARAHEVLTLHRHELVRPSMSREDRIARQTAYIKTGQWSALDTDELIEPTEVGDAVASALFLARSVRTNSTSALANARALLERFSSVRGGGSWRVAALLLPFLRRRDEELFDRCDRQLAVSLPDWIEETPGAVSALRSAASAARQSFRPLARSWARTSAHVEGRPALAGGEAVALAQMLESGLLQPARRALIQAIDAKRVAEVAKIARARGQRGLRVELPALRSFCDWLLGLEAWPDAIEPGLRAFFAARREEWIIPVGYLAHFELRRGDAQGELKQLFAQHEEGRLFGWLGSRPEPELADGLAVARRADEAGDMEGLLEALGRVAASRRDIDELLEALKRWRETLAEFPAY